MPITPEQEHMLENWPKMLRNILMEDTPDGTMIKANTFVAELMDAQKDSLWEHISLLQKEYIGNEEAINILEKTKDLLSDF